ncbi:SPX and EXS domain-containing protein 1-like [Dorcoceras hygrometricum]|uniref:SPX and EXS domain-containing protein 1-like n=1 Tax=Dorcoceras hygrometricum TaxID=472368 RepID=A0A2Z7CNA6_9LAMI|nr:SPX and EXS domain-containing protein 1-like [Dorcoceras hygrometricum]
MTVLPLNRVKSRTCVTLNGSGIQLAVGPQPLWLRNHNSGPTQRIMVKRLATSPHDPLGITDSACKNQSVVVSVLYGPFNPYIPIRSTTIDSIGYPRMSASGESSTTMHRLLHASGSHPIPTPGDPKTNQYNQDLGLIHSTNGNHLESPKEGSSIDHQVTIYLHAQNITMFPTNETCVSQGRFDLMVAIMGGIKLNWSKIFFRTLHNMVYPTTKQTHDFAIQISRLLQKVPRLKLGESKALHSMKFLSGRIISTYVIIHSAQRELSKEKHSSSNIKQFTSPKEELKVAESTRTEAQITFPQKRKLHWLDDSGSEDVKPVANALRISAPVARADQMATLVTAMLAKVPDYNLCLYRTFYYLSKPTSSSLNNDQRTNIQVESGHSDQRCGLAQKISTEDCSCRQRKEGLFEKAKGNPVLEMISGIRICRCANSGIRALARIVNTPFCLNYIKNLVFQKKFFRQHVVDLRPCATAGHRVHIAPHDVRPSRIPCSQLPHVNRGTYRTVVSEDHRAVMADGPEDHGPMISPIDTLCGYGGSTESTAS